MGSDRLPGVIPDMWGEGLICGFPGVCVPPSRVKEDALA